MRNEKHAAVSKHMKEVSSVADEHLEHLELKF
jgi:hypothetical protein